MPELYRGLFGEDKKKIAEIGARIRAACPNVTLENWQDYGLKLTGYLKDSDGATIISSIRVICQPACNGQPEIIADVDALIKEWST